MQTLIRWRISLTIGSRTLDPGKMRTLWSTVEAKAKSLGMWPPKTEFYDRMKTLSDAERFLGMRL